ncbi:MAG: hypothetical protein IT459_19765 [Planctomycetes bacterium]|nr:hypothetical protein [Planctomycetota bacterium]
MNDTEERDDGLPRELAKLRATPSLPPALAADVLSALRREGLVQRASRRSWIGRAALAAACVVLGVVVGRATVPSAPQAGEPLQSDYAMLLLRPETDDPRYVAGTPEQTFGEYQNWAMARGKAGQLVLGEKLADERLMVREGDRVQGLPEGTSDTVEGLFLIRAKSIEEARAIVASCPHVLRGGRVELRRIDGP